MPLLERLNKEKLRLLFGAVVILIMGLVILVLNNAGIFQGITQAVLKISILLLNLLLSIDQSLIWILIVVICFLISLSVIPTRSFRKAGKNKAFDYVPKHPVASWISVLEDSLKFPSDSRLLASRVSDLQQKVNAKVPALPDQDEELDESMRKLGQFKKMDALVMVEEIIEDLEQSLEIKNE